jgi:hypothetical protein
MAGAWISTARREAELLFELFCPHAQNRLLKLEIELPLRRCLSMGPERFDNPAGPVRQNRPLVEAEAAWLLFSILNNSSVDLKAPAA